MANQQERAVIDLVINGEQAKASLKQIKAEAIDARKEFNRMAEADDPAAYAKKAEQVKLLESAAKSMGDRLKETASGWQVFLKEGGTILAGVAGGNIATWGLETLVGLIPMALDKSVKLKDQLADIAKTTNMTDEEVKALNSDLKDFNTRTATSELRDMAKVAGQFGVEKDQIKGFVQATDVANVALGDQFENAEAVATEMTGLRNVFGDIKTDDVGGDMLKIANSINALESAGAATAPVLADMSSRIGGVAIPLGLASSEVLGLSATLQELNVTSERGSTAVVDILNGMAKAPDAFAKYAINAKGASMSTKEFAHEVNTNMMEALRDVIRGFAAGDASATGMAAKLDDMGMNGNGVMEVFMKLASNTDILEKRIGLAKDTIGSTDSVMGEFNKKNYDLAVNLKKLSEWFGGLLSKSGLPGLAEWLVSATTRMLGLTSASERAASAAAAATQSWQAQRDTVKGLEKDTEPLVKRYDELQRKAKLSTTEQKELRDVVQKIAEIIPSAVTQFDQMGRAMAISTDKARDYVREQKAVLEYTNRVAIEENKLLLLQTLRDQKFILAKRQSGKEVTASRGNTGSVSERAYTADELRKMDETIQAKNKEIAAAEDVLLGLGMDETKLPTYMRRRRAQRNQNMEGGNVTVAPPAPKVDAPVGETEAERKKREKEERKHARELSAAQKHQDDYQSLLSQARQRTAKDLDNTFEKEQLQFGDHYAKLLRAAGTDKAKQAEVRALMYAELEALQTQNDEREQKAAEKAQQERDKRRQEELNDQRELNDLYYDMSLTALDEEHADREGKIGLTADGKIDPTKGEAELNMLRLQEQEKFLTAMLMAQQAYGKSSADTQTTLTENHAQQARLRAETEYAYAQQMKQTEQALQQAKRDALQQGIEVLKSFFGQHTIVYKAAVAAQKAYAIADVIVNAQQEISQIWKNPAWSLLPDGGATIKGIQTGITVARSAAAIATIAKTGYQEIAQKDDGGFTSIQDLYGDPSGFYSQPTRVNAGRRSYIVGEKRREFIMGGAMLQDPVFANLAGALDAVQRRGDYTPFGQIMSEQARASSSAPAGPDYGMQLLAMGGEMRQIRADMASLANRPVLLNYRLLEEYEDQLSQVRTETSL